MGENGIAGTGGGGGGNQYNGLPSSTPTNHGTGGSGVVIVRYQIGTSGQPEGFTARATGGAVTFAGGKTIHTFLSSGQFVAPTALTIDYLMVGGGGGASGNNGSGGGGGGICAATGAPISSGTYPIVIGSGGPGGESKSTAQHVLPGGDTTFNGMTAGGGGRGAHYPGLSGGTGRNTTGNAGGTSIAIGGSGGGGGHPGGTNPGPGGSASGADTNQPGYVGGGGSG